MRTTGILALTLGLLFALACADPRSTPLPSDLEAWSSNEDLQAAVASLSEEEKGLFVAYILRSSLASAFGGEDVPAEATIGSAIDAQRRWKAEQEIEESKQAALAAKLEQEKVEKLREMNEAVTVTLMEFGFQPSNARAGRYSDRFTLEIGFESGIGVHSGSSRRESSGSTKL